jgi:predicted transcriptional regulator
MPQRDRYDIVKDLLEIIYVTEPLYRNQMNQTRNDYEANLIHFQVVRSLKELVGLGLLTRIDFKPYPYYEITTNGKRCLQLFGEIDEDLKPESTDL